MQFLISLGNHLRDCRLRLHMTQPELADHLNELAHELGYDTEYNVFITPSHISRWEHGSSVMNVVQEDLMMRALLTSVADAHNIEDDTDLDKQLTDAVKRFSFRSREVMYYLLAKWDGNCRALLEANLLYSRMPAEKYRSMAIENLLSTYNAAQRAGKLLDCPLDSNFLYVEREQEKL